MSILDLEEGEKMLGTACFEARVVLIEKADGGTRSAIAVKSEMLDDSKPIVADGKLVLKDEEEPDLIYTQYLLAWLVRHMHKSSELNHLMDQLFEEGNDDENSS